MDAEELIEELNDRFANTLDEDAYDISLSEDDGTIEVATDDWTLVIESWPAGIAYLALDDEPDTTDPDQLRTAMARLIGAAAGPLTAANNAADGLLIAALIRTRDPLSNALAGVLGGE
jgi:hypothetical protein